MKLAFLALGPPLELLDAMVESSKEWVDEDLACVVSGSATAARECLRARWPPLHPFTLRPLTSIPLTSTQVCQETTGAIILCELCTLGWHQEVLEHKLWSKQLWTMGQRGMMLRRGWRLQRKWQMR